MKTYKPQGWSAFYTPEVTSAMRFFSTLFLLSFYHTQVTLRSSVWAWKGPALPVPPGCSARAIHAPAYSTRQGAWEEKHLFSVKCSMWLQMLFSPVGRYPLALTGKICAFRHHPSPSNRLVLVLESTKHALVKKGPHYWESLWYPRSRMRNLMPFG